MNHLTIMLSTERWMKNKIRESDTMCSSSDVWMYAFECSQSSKQYLTVLFLFCVFEILKKGAKIVGAVVDQQTLTKRK